VMWLKFDTACAQAEIPKNKSQIPKSSYMKSVFLFKHVGFVRIPDILFRCANKNTRMTDHSY